VVNSEGKGPTDVTKELLDLNDLKGQTKNPCSAGRIDDLLCTDIPGDITTGREEFVFGVRKKIYINNYDVIINSGTDAKGEGLLYLPLVKIRIPVEWTGLKVNRSQTGDYGCVLAPGQIQMQGSQSGVISGDLHRQVIALLTQGPGAWSGKLSDSFDAFVKIIAEIEQTETPTVEQLAKFQNIGKIVVKAIDEWTPLLDLYDTPLNLDRYDN
jgi:hypothetical protein